MASGDRPDPPPELAEHPPSVELVYWLLDEHGPASIPELAAISCRSRSTIRDSLLRLERASLADRTPDPNEPGQHRWKLESRAETSF